MDKMKLYAVISPLCILFFRGIMPAQQQLGGKIQVDSVSARKNGKPDGRCLPYEPERFEDEIRAADCFHTGNGGTDSISQPLSSSRVETRL